MAPESASETLVDIKTFFTESLIPDDRGAKIPKNLFQTYKTSLFDVAHARRLKQFRDGHPQFSFYFYDDDAMDRYMAESWSGHPIHAVYQGAVFGPSKADIWRYCILYEHGGVYLDIDSAINFDMNTIPPQVDEVLAFEGNMLNTFSWHYQWPFTTFFADKQCTESRLSHSSNIVLQWLLIFGPGHPILKRMIDLIVEYADFYRNRPFENVLHAVVSFAGPVLFTKAVWEHVETGATVFTLGRDFNGQAVFKNIPDPANSIYLNDTGYYANKINKPIYRDLTVLDLGVADCAGLASMSGLDRINIESLLELVPAEQIGAVLASCHQALAPEGLLHIRMPCLEQALASWQEGALTLEGFQQHFDGERRSFPAQTQVLQTLKDLNMKVLFVKPDTRDTVKGAQTGGGVDVVIRARKAG